MKFDADDWFHQFRASLNDFPALLYEHQWRLTDFQYWACLRVAWTSANIHPETARHMLTACPKKPHWFMSRAEFKFLQSLPAEFPIYRGYDNEHPSGKSGFSWTIDRDQAVWFAHRFANAKRKPILATGVCRRADVLGFIDDRNEKEIVIFPENVRNISESVLPIQSDEQRQAIAVQRNSAMIKMAEESAATLKTQKKGLNVCQKLK